MTAKTCIHRRLVCALLALLLIASACSPAPSPSPSSAASPSAAAATPAGPSVTPSIPSASDEPSATPAPSPTPSPTPTSSPAAFVPGWSYVADGWFNAIRFTPDGGVITVEISTAVQAVAVRRLASDGSLVTGWPWREDNADLADAMPGPNGSTYVIARIQQNVSEYQWALHRLDAHGAEMAGFPVTLPAVELCRIAVAADGAAVTSCSREDSTTSLWVATLTRVRPNGRVTAGWPTRVHGEASPLGFLANGDVALLVNDYDYAASRGTVHVVMLRPNGRLDPAWRALRFSDTSTVRLSAAGRVVVVSHADQDGECGAAISTTYRVLGSRGLPAAGWPVTIRGWGSDPVIRADGSLVVAASGGRVRAWSAAGHTLPGWPLSGIDVATGCSSGSTPVAAGGGAVVVLGAKHVTILNGHGQVVGGWPVTLADQVALTCMGCTPGPAGPLTPAGGVSVYVPAYHGASTNAGIDGQPRIVVLDGGGQAATSWNGLIGAVGDELRSVQVAPGGHVWAVIRHPDSNGPRDSLVLVGDESGAS